MTVFEILVNFITSKTRYSIFCAAARFEILVNSITFKFVILSNDNY